MIHDSKNVCWDAVIQGETGLGSLLKVSAAKRVLDMYAMGLSLPPSTMCNRMALTP